MPIKPPKNSFTPPPFGGVPDSKPYKPGAGYKPGDYYQPKSVGSKKKGGYSGSIMDKMDKIGSLDNPIGRPFSSKKKKKKRMKEPGY